MPTKSRYSTPAMWDDVGLFNRSDIAEAVTLEMGNRMRTI